MTRRNIFIVASLLASMLVLRFLGFRGACQHYYASTDAKPAPLGYHLLDNAWFKMNPIKPYTLVFFMSKDCPICKHYKPLIHQLYDSLLFNPRFGIVIFRTDAPEDSSYYKKPEFIPMEMSNYNRDYPMHRVFGATMTPEVFVVDSSSRIVYQGAIDNYAYDTGKHRLQATEHYLLDVIQQLKWGKQVSVQSHPAVGCYIE